MAGRRPCARTTLAENLINENEIATEETSLVTLKILYCKTILA